MLSGKLKTLTRESHQALEKKVIERVKAIQNETDYTKVLGHFYSFFGGMENLIACSCKVSFLTDYASRRKAAFIAKDLQALSAPLPALATEPELPVIKNEFQVTGVLYVIEGSTLGGVYIANMIRKKLNDAALDAFSFFDGYGSQTNNRWDTFRNAIDSLELTNDQETTVFTSAEATFSLFNKWLNDHL